MDRQELDNLIMAAMEPDKDEAVLQLLNEIKTADLKLLKDSAPNFDLLIEAWDESVYKSLEKATICFILAEKSILDSTAFRIALNSAIRKILPPYISSPGVAKAIGARDSEVSVCEIAQRIRKLQHLKTNAYVYQMDSRVWGRIINIDRVVATLAVSSFASGGQISIPISSALVNCFFFEANSDMTNFAAGLYGPLKPAAFYRERLHRNSLGDLSETKAKDIIQQMTVPAIMSQEAFNTWWSQESADVKTVPAKRTFREARSMLELQMLLKDVPQEELTLTPDEAGKLSRLFTHLRPNIAPKDLEMLAVCAATLANSGDDEVLKTLFSGLRGKVPFFPAEITKNIPLKNLEIWGRIPVRLLAGFMKIAGLLYSKLEIAKLAMVLPQRCINIIFDSLSQDDIMDAVFASSKLSSDVLLIIWKNKAYPEELRAVVSMTNICLALSEENLPKEWTAAQRELKKALFDKADFQKFVLANAGSNIPSVINPIQRMHNMHPGECQSLLVKLSRYSQELKEHIESGAGQQMLAGRSEEQTGKQHDETPMTSRKSYKALAVELDDIVRVQVPENNKAIEIARGFGDFRENAEYDAAKERRRFLQRRRSELETLVATVQPIDFLVFKADTSKVSMGTKVTLKEASGEEKVYSIVGAWDGDPDRNLVSYKTKFGEALLGAKTGDTVTLPDGSKVTVQAIAPLDADLAKELSPAE